MKIVKKISAIILSIVLCLASVSFQAPVKAGDGIDLDGVIKGLNADKTINPGDTISIAMTDLCNLIDMSFVTRYNAGNANVYFNFRNADYSESEDVAATYDNGYFKVKVDKKYAGKYLVVYISDPGYTNYNSGSYRVLDNPDSGEGGGSGETINVVSGPYFTGVQYKGSLLNKTLYVNWMGSFQYYLSSAPSDYKTCDDIIIKLYVDGKLIATKTNSSGEVVFGNVKVKYNKTTNIKVAMSVKILGVEIAGPAKTYTISNSKLGKNKVFATKLNSKSVSLRWTGVVDAEGYYIYMGKKKIKTVSAKTNRVTIKKKKAGKSKFKVIPIVKSGKTVYKGSSNKAKPKSNVAKFSRSLNVRSYSYATCPYVITKVSLKGKTYTVTGYAVNNRIFKMKKYKTLSVILTVDGKKAFGKKFKNKKLNVKPTSVKKFSFKVKGKAGKDLANGRTYLSVNYDPVW